MPDPKRTLGIKLPFLVMIIKNLKKYFTFEVQVLDDKVSFIIREAAFMCMRRMYFPPPECPAPVQG